MFKMAYHLRLLIFRIQTLNLFRSKYILPVSLLCHLLFVLLIYTQNVALNSLTIGELKESVRFLGKHILLLEDFNNDLLNVNQSDWQNITRNNDLSQCITLPTRITSSSRTKLEHIYSSNPSSLTEIYLPCIDVSDHHTTFVTWSKKNFKIPRQ